MVDSIRKLERIAYKPSAATPASVGGHKRTMPTFSEQAYAFVVEYIQVHGPISGELVTNAAKQAGIRPGDDRAFGPIYARALREGLVQVIGTTIRTKGHGTGGARVYVAGGSA